eukprot:194085-Amphidinium_carterae.1
MENKMLNSLPASTGVSDDALLEQARTVLPVVAPGPALWREHMDGYYSEFKGGKMRQAIVGKTRTKIVKGRWRAVMECLRAAVGCVGTKQHKSEVVDLLLSLGSGYPLRD